VIKYPNFWSIPRLVQNQSITYKELALINEVIPVMSEYGLQQLEERFQDFLSAVTQKVIQSDVTWQSILKCFLFHPEVLRVNAFLDEHGSEHTLEKRREIRLALQVSECQFDCDTVAAYLEEEHKIKSNLGSGDEENF